MPLPVDPDLLQRIAAVVQADRSESSDVYFARLKEEVTVNPELSGYFNPKVTLMLDRMISAEVTHLKFDPLKDDGRVIIRPATKEEIGAVAFDRSTSGRAGEATLRSALLEFNLTFPRSRSLRMPVEVLPVTLLDGRKVNVMILTVKRPGRKARTTRKKKTAAPPAGT